RECAPDDRLREAIHAKPKKEWIASTQVLLAMTENIASRSRRMFCARFGLIVRPSEKRGRRECRVPNAPAASCALCSGSMHTSIHSGGTGNIRHSPRDGVTAYCALSPGTGLFCPRHP